MSDTNLPKKIAFLIDCNDKGNEVKAIASPRGKSWKIAGVMPSPKESELFRLAFLLAARAQSLAIELEKQCQEPDAGSRSAAGNIPLINVDHPDYPIWHSVARSWLNFLKSHGPDKYKSIPQQLKNDLAALFPKRGKEIKGKPLPSVTVARCMSLKDLFLCSLPGYNVSKEREPSAIPKLGEKLTLKDLQNSALDIQRLPDLMEQILDDIARRKNPDTWYVHYKEGLRELKPDYFYSLKVRERRRQERTRQTEQEHFIAALSSEPPSGLAKDYEWLLHEHSRSVLIGPSGAGKTTIMSALARAWIKEHGGIATPQVVPVFVRLGDYERGKKLHDLIVESICDITAQASRRNYKKDIERWLRSENSRGKYVAFLFDGYNDLTEGRRAFQQQFRKFHRSHPDNRIIVSAQTYGAEDLEPTWPRVRLEKPTTEQIEEYLQRSVPEAGGAVFNNQIKDDPKLLSLAETPFNLMLIAECIKGSPFAKLPTNQGKLIEFMVHRSIERKEGEGVILPDDVYDHEVQDFLQNVAHSLIKKRTLGDSGEDTQTTAVRHPDDTLPLWHRKDLASLQEVLKYAKAVGILRCSGLERHNNRVIFHHDKYTDYFAAQYLLHHGKELFENLESEYLEYMKWDEPLLMVADLRKDELFGLRLASEISQVDMFFGTEFLARSSVKSIALVMELLRGIDYIERCIPFAFMVPIKDIDLSTPQCVALSTLNEADLLKLYRELPYALPKHYSVVAALLFKYGHGWTNRFTLPEVEDPWTAFFILLGLKSVGDRDSLQTAIEMTRRAISYISSKVDRLLRGLWRMTLTEVLRRFSHDFSLELLLDMISSPENQDILTTLSSWLEEMHLDSDGFSKVVPLLSHPHFDIRNAAVYSIARSRIPAASGTLMEHLQQRILVSPQTIDSDEFLTIALTVGYLRPEVFQGALADFLRRFEKQMRASDPAQLVSALGWLRSEWAGELLADLLSKNIEPEKVVGYLRRFCGVVAITERLRNIAATHASVKIRSMATIALAPTRDEHALLHVMKILRWAAQSRKTGPKKEVMSATRSLTRSMKRPDKVSSQYQEAECAVELVSLLRWKEAAPYVFTLLKQDHVPVSLRTVCIDALAELGYTPSLPYIERLFYQNKELRWRSGRALIKLSVNCSCDERASLLLRLKHRSQAAEDKDSSVVWEVRQTVLAILQQQRQRFACLLKGWPSGLRFVPADHQPPWLSEFGRTLLPETTTTSD